MFGGWTPERLSTQPGQIIQRWSVRTGLQQYMHS